MKNSFDNIKFYMLTVLGLVWVLFSNAQSVYVTPVTVTLGESTYAYWDGFSSNINLELWKGSIKTADVWANAPGSCSGECLVELNTTGWEIGSDYRIKAVQRSNTNIYNFSNYFSVTSPVPPPSIPVLTYPSNGVTLNDDTPDLAWTADNASYFHVQLSTNSSFTNIVRENTNCNSFNWTPSVMSEGTYYWRVRTFGVNGSWSSWSNYCYFTIETIQAPSVPTLTYPPNGVTLNDNTPDLAWTADNASYFHVQISTNSSFTNIVRENTNCNSFNWTPSAMSDGTYYWRVRTYGVNVSWSNWSSARMFTIQTSPPPPSLIAPNGEISITSQIEFQWNHVSGAGRYRVKICTDQNMISHIAGSPFEAEYGATTISIPVIDFNPGQTYYWQVASIYPDDIGGWGEYGPSPAWSFYISEEQNIELLTPSSTQQINSKEVNFSWSLISGAVRYELFVDNNSGLGSPEISPQNINEITSTSYTISGNWLPPGHNFYWKVIAKDAEGNTLAESTTGTFIYTPEPDASPQWVPFYRAFHPDVVDHFYCSSQSHLQTAIDSSYRFEGTEGFVALFPFEVGPSNELVPIYRFYQHNEDIIKMRCHYYTSDDTDRDNRIIQGWIYEGIIGYGFKSSGVGLTSFYHTFLDIPNTRRDNFYTVSEIEKNNSISLFGYQDIGSICYVSATGENSTMTWLPGSVVAGNGINPFNGNFGNSSKSIFSLPEGNVALNYGHSYNSNSVRLLQSSEPLGVGRNHSYNISLQKTDSTIFILWGDEVHLYNLKTSSYITPGIYDTLAYIDPNTYRIRKKDQSIFTFQKLGVNNINNTYWLTSISDRHGNTITLEYNSNGWLKHVKSPANRFISFTYYPSSDTDKYGLIRYVKDSLALNRTVEYIYDNQRNLIEFRDVAGKSTFYKYDENYPFDHFLTEITYPDGTKITNTYDVGSKRLTSQNFVSDNLSKVTSVSLPTTGQVSITDEMNVVTDIKYNSIGNITELLTAAGDVKYEYSDNNNLTKPTKITDGMGYITTVQYDNRGNPEIINKPLNVTHTYTWNSTNDLISYKNPLDKTSTFTYNNGKLAAIQSPFGQSSSITTTINYFENGNVQSIIYPLDRTTYYTYDTYNNVKTIADNIGNTTTCTYDAASRLKCIKDANNHTTLYNYTIDDLLNDTSDPMNHKTSYYYDDLGRLTDIEDAKNNKTSMVYQPPTGLLNLISDQLGNNTTFTYFDNGLLNTKTTRNNHIFTFEYDVGNRLQSLSAPSINRSFTYNYNDLLTQLSDNSGNLTFNYDQLNRLTSHTDYFGNTVAYNYDNANNIIKVGYPGGKSVDYTYYDDGRINTVLDWLGNSTQYLYNLDGSLSRVNNPNGTYSEYTYDAAGRLIGLANKKSDNSIISSYTFVLDGVGNHIEVTVTEPLSSPVPDAANITYSYNQANRIERAGDITFSHDLNGNMTSQNDNGLISNFTFSAEDRLTGVSGAFNASYQYDGMGYRRQATRGGVTTRYVLNVNGSMENILMETDALNQPLYYYIHGNGLLYRIKASDNTIQYYHTDIRGSTIAITDHAQNLTHQYTYDEFGNVSNSLEADFNAFRYVGKYGVMYENEDLYFMRARFYKPSLGRFVSEDPVWFANLYVYSNNNPFVLIDPTGKIFKKISEEVIKETVRAGTLTIKHSIGKGFSYAKGFFRGSLSISNIGKGLIKGIISDHIIRKMDPGDYADLPFIIGFIPYSQAKYLGGALDPNNPEDAIILEMYQGF